MILELLRCFPRCFPLGNAEDSKQQHHPCTGHEVCMNGNTSPAELLKAILPGRGIAKLPDPAWTHQSSITSSSVLLHSRRHPAKSKPWQYVKDGVLNGLIPSSPTSYKGGVWLSYGDLTCPPCLATCREPFREVGGVEPKFMPLCTVEPHGGLCQMYLLHGH